MTRGQRRVMSALMSRWTARIAPLLLTLVLLAGWEAICRGLNVPAYLLPRPSEIALALAVALSPVLERAVRPLAVAVQVTPVVAIAPLVVIWAGLDHPERAIVA